MPKSNTRSHRDDAAATAAKLAAAATAQAPTHTTDATWPVASKPRGTAGVIVISTSIGNAALETHPLKPAGSKPMTETDRVQLELELEQRLAVIGARTFFLNTYAYERALGAPLEENRIRALAFFVCIANNLVLVAYGITREGHLVLSGTKVEDGRTKALATFQTKHTPVSSVKAWSRGTKGETTKRFFLTFRGNEASMEYV